MRFLYNTSQMENSIEEIRSVALYHLMEGDFGQAESLSQHGRDKFDAWELEAYLAFAVSKTSQREKALRILADSVYAKGAQVNALFRELQRIIRRDRVRTDDWQIENEEVTEVLCELLCLEGSLQEASSLIRKLSPGFRKSNLEGLFHLQSFRFSFDQTRRLARHFDLRGSDHFLLNSRKHFGQSLSEFPSNTRGVMGMAQVCFFQKDFKAFSLHLSVLKNSIKNQQHPITSTPALPTCTGFKISLLESLHEARSNISNANVFNEQQRRRKFKDLVSNVGVYQTQNLAFLADVVRLLSNHFQLTQSWQRRVLKDEMGSLAGGLFLGFNADSGDFPDLVRLAENLMLLMIQLGDLDNAKFVFQQVKELGSLSDELTVLSLLAGILGGNTSDAESSLALFEDTSKDNAFLFELLLSCRLLLFCKTYSSRGPDTSLMFSTLREYTSLVREKILTGGKYPSCPETLSACGLGIASVVFLEIRKRFARSFQTSVLSLLLNNSRFEDFHPESSFLKLFSLCLGKLAKLGEHFFGDTEQTSSLRAFETLTQTRGATSVLSEVSPCSVEYDYVLNCQFFVSAIHRGRVRDLAEYLSHKKAVNLDLNNHLSFLFFEVLACYLNQNGDKCLTLLRKTFENIDKKSFINDTQVNYGMLQILYVIEHLLCCNRPQTQVLKPEIFQQVTRLCPEILPWNELTLLLESDRFFKSHKLDKAINCLLVRGSSRVFACLAIEKISCFSKTYKLKCLIAYLERSLDFGIVFRIVDVLCEQCELQKCLEVVDFLIQNWKSAAWFDLIKLLKSVVPSSSSFDCPDLSPLLVDKTSASPLQVKVSYFISPDELCVLNLLKGRLLTRLSLTRKALEFYQKMVASPNSSFFILDFAMLLVSEGEYLSTLNLLNLEFYFQKCPRSAEYLSFDQIFKQEHAARVDFQITELQLVRECLLHLTGDLPANQNSEDILSKLESLQQNPGNSCSRHFRSELRLTSRFLLKLSEVRLARGNTRNPFKLFIDAQSHLVLGIKHCPHVESQEYSKLEKMVSQKPSPFAVEDFLSASMSSSSELDRATCFQIQRCLQRESRLFVSADDFSHTSSTFEVFGFLKNLNTQQMSKRKNKSKHSMTSSVLCSGSFDLTPPYLGKLFLASYADKENASDLRLISNLKTNTFRSPALTLTYSSTENLFRLRNIQVARENQNFERLKAESKGVLKSEFKPEAVWGLADALLPKKRHAASADGFFKMLKREQATTQKDPNLVFSVGVFLLQGGLFAECLEYLNLLLEPVRIQFLQKISTPLPQVSEKENQDHLLNTEYVLPQSGGPLVQINSRAQCARSFYSLYDDIVLKHQTKRRPQLAFLLGVYFYKIKRLDPASKSFIRALESPFLQVPSLLHLLDISLHETSYNLYSNHFHKEKYSRVSDGNRANLSFAVESLVSLDIPAVLKRALRLVLDFVRILNAKEENKQLILQTHASLESLLEEARTSSPSFCLGLYMQLILLLKTKQIPNCKAKIKEHLVKSRGLTFAPYFGQNTFFFRCTLLCADILLSKDKVSPALQLVNKAVDLDRANVVSQEYLILVHKKGLKDTGKARQTLEEVVKKTRFSEPNLGYRLAQEYLQQGEVTRAYHVSSNVLKHYPNFNQLKANVYGPARKKLHALL